jgi:hypothetical protein
MGRTMARSGSAVGGKDELLPLPQILRFVGYRQRYLQLLPIFLMACSGTALRVSSLTNRLSRTTPCCSTTHHRSAGSSVGAIARLCPLRKSLSGPSSHLLYPSLCTYVVPKSCHGWFTNHGSEDDRWVSMRLQLSDRASALTLTSTQTVCYLAKASFSLYKTAHRRRSALGRLIDNCVIAHSCTLPFFVNL